MQAQSLESIGLTFQTSEISEKSETRQLSMFCAEDFPVRTSAPQERAQASTGNVQDYGESTPESLAKYDPDSCSWKTSQLCLGGDLAEFSETWPRSGMTRNGTAYRLPPLVLTTKGTGSGLLPTLTLCGNYNRKGASKTSGDGIITALKMLPTLTARDFKSDSRTPEYRARRDAMTMGKTLPWTLGGLLNPRWCEVFMGYPIGWTELEPSEMPSSRKSPKSSGGQL